MLKGTSLSGGSGGSRKRVENDYYATPPYVTDMFLNKWLKDDNINSFSHILEPSCGEGHISNVIMKYGKVSSFDLIDRGYEYMIGTRDFIKDDYTDNYDLVITNPPFKYAQEFIEKAYDISSRWVVMFAKIQLLESEKRKYMFENTRLKYIYIHSKRVEVWRNGQCTDENGKKWANTMCFAWFVWDKKYTGEPVVRWL